MSYPYVVLIVVATMVVAFAGLARTDGNPSGSAAGESAAAAPSAPSDPCCAADADGKTKRMPDKVVKSEADWKKQLTPEQYRVLRQKGTERPFTGAYWDTKTPGVYRCAGCGAELFRSETKFDAGCGWPSFYQPLDKSRVEEHTDRSFGMERTEVVCSKCGGHLGHVFDDGPAPTGLRYCINSVSLKLDAESERKADAGGKSQAEPATEEDQAGSTR